MGQILLQGPEESLAEREGGDVSRLAECPVVGGEGPRQCALAQGDDKVEAPEQAQHIVDLQVEHVSLEKTLAVVFNEDTLGRGTGQVERRVEGLRRTEKRGW